MRPGITKKPAGEHRPAEQRTGPRRRMMRMRRQRARKPSFCGTGKKNPGPGLCSRRQSGALFTPEDAVAHGCGADRGATGGRVSPGCRPADKAQNLCLSGPGRGNPRRKHFSGSARKTVDLSFFAAGPKNSFIAQNFVLPRMRARAAVHSRPEDTPEFSRRPAPLMCG